jgi:hypothetical protein
VDGYAAGLLKSLPEFVVTCLRVTEARESAQKTYVCGGFFSGVLQLYIRIRMVLAGMAQHLDGSG